MSNNSSNKLNVPQAKQGMEQSRTAVGHVQRVAYIAAVMI